MHEDRGRYERRGRPRGRRTGSLQGALAGRRPWTVAEVQRLRAAWERQRSAVAVWRSGEVPDRTLAGIKCGLHDLGLRGPEADAPVNRLGVALTSRQHRWLRRFGRGPARPGSAG